MAVASDDVQVVLVSPAGEPTGVADKLDVHRSGDLHLAVSAFVFDRAGRLLMQRRAHDKYHSGGLWSNTACTHPQPAEAPLAAAHRALQHELGFDCPLLEATTVIYHAPLENGMIEHEYVIVFTGSFDGQPVPNPSDVSDYRWVPWTAACSQARAHPADFTAWFPLLIAALKRNAGHSSLPSSA
jgi:isopentenyl-diphosphate delta-isomerase